MMKTMEAPATSRICAPFVEKLHVIRRQVGISLQKAGNTLCCASIRHIRIAVFCRYTKGATRPVNACIIVWWVRLFPKRAYVAAKIQSNGRPELRKDKEGSDMAKGVAHTPYK